MYLIQKKGVWTNRKAMSFRASPQTGVGISVTLL